MSKDSKSQKPKKTIEVLELNKEMLQDLTEPEAEQVKGGALWDSDICLFPPTLGGPKCNG
jgi:hypothetical protein